MRHDCRLFGGYLGATVTAALFVLSGAGRLPAEEAWSGFRGPDGMGVSSIQGLATTWSESQNIAWKSPLPGPGASSPVVWNDRIYITCYSGFFVPDQPGGTQQDLRRHLVALKLDDGSVIWDKPVPAKLPEEDAIRDHGFAANTPAVSDEHIYVFYGKTGVLAFDHDGNEKWRADVGSNTNGWGTAASPVIHGDQLLVNASVESESLVALNRLTGKEVWRARGIKEAWNTPVLVKTASGREELVVASQGKILAFSPDKGTPLWSCDTDITWYMVPSLVASEDIICCLGGRSGVAALAVRSGGTGDVTKTHRLWTGEKGSNVSSPVISGKHLYWMNDQRGTVYCAEIETGKVLYEERLNRAGQTYASALLAGGNVYYLTRDGQTFVVAAQPQFQLVATNDLRDGSLFNGSIAVAGTKLLIRSDKYLYCIGSK